jgi:hypothetical protein
VGHRNALAAEITAGLRERRPRISHPDETVAEGKQVVTGAI